MRQSEQHLAPPHPSAGIIIDHWNKVITLSKRLSFSACPCVSIRQGNARSNVIKCVYCNSTPSMIQSIERVGSFSKSHGRLPMHDLNRTNSRFTFFDSKAEHGPEDPRLGLSGLCHVLKMGQPKPCKEIQRRPQLVAGIVP